MQIIPAIDIKDGHCVRLKQGDMQSVTVFSEDPAAMAQHWLEQGAQRLHIVDLNGAVAGIPKNELAIREIVSVIGEEIPVQLGGGIRDTGNDRALPGRRHQLHRHRDCRRQEPGLPARGVLRRFPGTSWSGSMRARGKVAADGWSKMTGHDVVDLRAQVRGLRRGRHHLHRHRARRHAARASTSTPRSSSRAKSRCR